MKYLIGITEVQRQVLLDALDRAIEEDVWTDNTEWRESSDLREALAQLPTTKRNSK